MVTFIIGVKLLPNSQKLFPNWENIYINFPETILFFNFFPKTIPISQKKSIWEICIYIFPIGKLLIKQNSQQINYKNNLK